MTSHYKSPVAASIPFDNGTNGFASIDAQKAIEEAQTMGIVGVGGSLIFAFDGNASTGRWLEVTGNLSSDKTGYIIAGTKLIRALSFAGNITSTYTATCTFYKNGVALDTISLSASRKITKLNLSHSLTDLDEITAKITAGSVAQPVVCAW
jgi:hypothetical protein